MKAITGLSLGVQSFVGHMPDPRRVLPLRNGDGVMIPSQKPLGGIWTSTWDARRGTSAWMENLALRAAVQRLRRGGLDCWLITPQAEARLLLVDGLDDLRLLLLRYGRRVDMRASLRDAEVIRLYLDDLPKSQRGRRQPTTWLVPDYEDVAADGWLGIHLTARGARLVRFTTPHLYTWDGECSFWCCGGGFGLWPFGPEIEHVGNLTERIVLGMLEDGTARRAGEDQRIASGNRSGSRR